MALLRSLTARLVITTVALVVVVAVLIGGAATFALHSRLIAQVDQQLPGQHGGAPAGGPGGRFQGVMPSLRSGSLYFVVTTSGAIENAQINGDGFNDNNTELTSAQIAQLEKLTPDARIHDLDLTGAGDFRAVALHGLDQQSGQEVLVVIGVPTHDVNAAIRSLVIWETALIAAGALLAGAGGTYLVRRQLRPLNEVAETAHEVALLPLGTGEVEQFPRVPDKLTDERTEVGQVGSALNTLLEHVQTALDERHRSEQQVRQFVADASHELRTPLSTIAGYTELARRRPDDGATVATALGKVEEESARMTSLVEDLLLLARLDAGRPLDEEPVDLTRLLMESVNDARVVAPDHQWRLDLPDSTEPVEVTGDEQRLHQVVTNLLTNARKYTPAGTTVTVVGRPDGFDVHDDGPGFPADFVDKAFERFARVDQARVRVGGAGLGLSLVQAIVRSHGGSVSLASAPGDTTIAVRLR